MLLGLCLLLLLANSTWAAETDLCEVKLAVVTQREHNLTQHRGQQEQALAKEQIKSQFLQQRVTALEQEVVDLKKKLEPKLEEK